MNLDELHWQNHRITEISRVFLYLAASRDLCDSETVCSLFFEYLQLVDSHLKQVDQLVEQHLAVANRPRVTSVARKLIADSALLRRNFLQYIKRWTDMGSACTFVAEHQEFIQDSKELFEIFLDRLQRETELLYPLLHSLDPVQSRAKAA